MPAAVGPCSQTHGQPAGVLAVSGVSPPAGNLQSVEASCQPACCGESAHRQHSQAATPGAAHLDPQRLWSTRLLWGQRWGRPGPGVLTGALSSDRQVGHRQAQACGSRVPEAPPPGLAGSLLVGGLQASRQEGNGGPLSRSESARAWNRKGSSGRGRGRPRLVRACQVLICAA